MSTHADDFSMNNKIFKILAAFSLNMFIPLVVQAEVLVILPEKGPMALAASSVKDGIQAAYYAGKTPQTLRFVDNSQRSISDILAKEIKPDTRLVIGPLAREQVEQVVKAKPRVVVLALNQVTDNYKTVWQFALSPDEDARALSKVVQDDAVDSLLVLTQESQQKSTARFRDAMNRLWGDKMQDVSSLPKALDKRQGLLLLGDAKWLSSHPELPKERIYTIPLAIEENPSLPVGIQFCDTPALYQANWPDILKAYEKKPVSMPYQRLLAFGADAWQITETLLNEAKSAQFAGRTGKIRIVDNVIERQPGCMRVEPDGLTFR
jgi:outer membrane PBP1 activator LpoA protein